MYNITILIIVAIFVLDVSLSLLNYNYRAKPIPTNVADIYDEKEYEKWLNYTMEGFKVSIIAKVMNTVVLIVFLLLDVFPFMAKVSEGITTNMINQNLLFFAMYLVINYILGIGFTVYNTFVIEERYGFNKTTAKTFILDQVKSTVLTVILGGGLLSIIIYLYQRFGTQSLIYTWLIIMVLSLVINLLYTKVFIRIFNKLVPLQEGELYDKAKVLASDLGYEIKTISVMDASKRSSRLNAFFSGFGKFKSIILYDTLLEKCGTDEIISVLAHEIGHSKNKDVLKNFIISAIQMAAYLGILSFFLVSSDLAIAFGFEEIHFGFALILFGILLEPVGILVNIPMSAMSRKAEYKADYCATEAGFGEAMIRALRVLAKENFSNLNPHPVVVKLTYSHPPVSQRIMAITGNMQKNKH